MRQIVRQHNRLRITVRQRFQQVALESDAHGFAAGSGGQYSINSQNQESPAHVSSSLNLDHLFDQLREILVRHRAFEQDRVQLRLGCFLFPDEWLTLQEIFLKDLINRRDLAFRSSQLLLNRLDPPPLRTPSEASRWNDNQQHAWHMRLRGGRFVNATSASLAFGPRPRDGWDCDHDASSTFRAI
jgi:hypothetical protein